MTEVHSQLQDVFRDVFRDHSIILNEGMTAEDVDGWDSLTHINLIIAVEKRFGVKFATAEISRLKEDSANVGSLIQVLTGKLQPSK
jgi:acyl carrier protein